MDYRVFAKDLLKRKPQLEAAHTSVALQLKDLEEDAQPVLSSFHSDAQMRMKVIERELTMIEQGLSVLNDYQKDVMDTFFVHNVKGAADALMEKYYKERSGIYADRSKALDMFTRAVYGVIEM